MKLPQFLRGPWLAAIIVVPCIVGASMGFFAGPGPRFEANGVFSLTPPANGQPAAGSIDAYVADLRSALRQPMAVDGAREAVEARGAELIAGPTVIGGTGTDVRFTATATDDEAAAVAIESVAPLALQRLADKELERSLLELDAQNSAVRTTAAAVAAFEDEHGVRDVDNEYDRRSADLLDLRNTLAAASTPQQRAAIQRLLTEKVEELDLYAEVLVDWRRLDAHRAAALAGQTSAQARYNVVELWAQDLRVLHETMDIDIRETSSIGPRVRAAAPAMAAAALVIGAIAWLAHRRAAAVARHVEAHGLPPIEPRPTIVRPAAAPASTVGQPTAPASTPQAPSLIGPPVGLVTAGVGAEATLQPPSPVPSYRTAPLPATVPDRQVDGPTAPVWPVDAPATVPDQWLASTWTATDDEIWAGRQA